MKVARLLRAGPIEDNPLSFEDAPEPEPGPGEVLLKVRACGVCRTDLHTVEGELDFQPPIIPGHQVIGVVEKLGAGAHLFKAGERVGACWLNWACGDCSRCREGLENLCAKARFTGLSAQGGYAQSLAVPEAFLHRIPAKYSDAEAAPLLCTGAAGWRAYRACRTHKGQRLGLYGFGASAHLILQAARYAHLEVFVFSKTPDHREAAKKLGAFWVGAAGDHLPFQLDAAILFAPSGRMVPTALEALKPGGRLVLAGEHLTDIPSIPFELLKGEKSIQTVGRPTRDDIHHFLVEAEKHHFKVETKEYPLARAMDALKAVKKGKLGFSAVLTLA